MSIDPTRLRRRGARRLLGCLGLAGAIAVAVPAQAQAQAEARTALIEQGNYWQSMGRADLAEESWRKLLTVDPQSADAMYGMSQVELARGNADAARSWIARLHTAHPTDARGTPVPQQPGTPQTDLQRARAAAQAGRVAEALQIYRRIFGGGPPPEPLALEYDQLLGGTPQGWEEGHKGLEQLVKDHPDNLSDKLALAQLLTYREPTRREGIHSLAELAGQPGAIGSAARAGWRQALIWLDAREADAGLYRDYLASQPDPALQARLDGLTAARTAEAASPAAQPLGEGFKALDRGDQATAEQRFHEALRVQPGDAEALGGLGLIRLKQERFAEAQQLLEQASRNGGRKWASALQSATYWNLIGQANAARSRGDTRAAQGLLERAVKLDPRQTVGQIALADLRLANGDLAGAQQGYALALESKPNDIQALRGLLSVYTRQGRSDEAMALSRRLTPEQASQIGSLQDMRVEAARAKARSQLAAGDSAGARLTLEDAMLAAPDSPWVRLDLANIYRSEGLMAQARGVMDGLLMSQRDMPDALYASALFAADADDPAAGLQYLDRIPAASRTRDMALLQHRLWAAAQAQQAQALARHGQVAAARDLLAQTQAGLGSDIPPELQGQLAVAYADIGDAPRALAMSRQLLARNANPSIGDRLLYASILLKTKQDTELSAVLRELQPASMTTAQRADYDSLRVAFSLRQADALREAGNLEAAYKAMAPLLAERPEDPQVLSARARLYSAARDEKQALALYQRILQRHPDDVDALIAAAASASALGANRDAESYAQAALKIAPDQSRVLAAAGRVYRNAGDNQQAEEYLRAAVAAESRAAGAVNLAADQAATNPLRAELQDIESERSTTLDMGSVVRNRAGEAGLGKLWDVEVPIEARFPAGNGKIVVTATPTVLDNGTMAQDYGTTSRFGGGPQAAINQFSGLVPAPESQKASGVGLSVGYEGKNLNASIGTTPLGFKEVNAVGNLAYSGSITDKVSFKADLSRQAVTDSLLSFAGTEDTRTGQTWGGVVATGGRLDMTRDDGKLGFYGYGSAYSVTGHNVEDNSRYELGGGVYVHLLSQASSSLTTGMNVDLLAYDKNLSFFTFGQGGYFSPENYTSVTFPVDWTGRDDRLAWRLNASLGVQSFKEDASPYFPTDPALQAGAAAAVANATRLGLNQAIFTGFYPSNSHTGIAYNLGGVLEYEVAPQLYLGGALVFNNAQNYRQVAVSAYLRYMLGNIGRLGAPGGSGMSLKPVSSPYTPLL
ncbi:MAG TPA: cellulose synthase subunit BcsC-related outer membrane protein [Variovorax sp.]